MGDLEAGADFFALDGLERIDGALVRAGVRERTGEERHFLTDADLGLLVVERHDVRRRDDVGIAVAAQRVQQRRPTGAGIRDLADAEREAFGDGAQAACRRPTSAGQADDAAARVAEVLRPSDFVLVVAGGQPGDARAAQFFLAELDDDRVDLHLEARNSSI